MTDMTVSASRYDFGPARSAMQRYVDREILPGVSWAVLVDGQLVDVHCVGWADKEAKIPLRADHIFRAFSNTKLITTCAVMLLIEEGRVRLDDPIETYITQLGSRRVLRPDAASLAETEPANGSITIRHLLSHSSGLSYGLLDPGTVIYRGYVERKVLNPATPLSDMIEQLAGLPLVFHPGTAWEYSVATDVLSRLIEVVSGERFDAFIEARILEPAGMTDTAFVVPEAGKDRLVAYYAGADLMDPMKPGLTRADDSPYPGAFVRRVPRLSGGGGLVSTLPDMVALIRGLLPGPRALLKPQTVAEMMKNQLPAGVWMRFPALGAVPGRAYGLAGGVVVEPSSNDHPAARGELFWGGIAGTQWWINPKANIAGLMMTQRQMAFWHPFAGAFKRLTYQAVVGR